MMVFNFKKEDCRINPNSFSDKQKNLCWYDDGVIMFHIDRYTIQGGYEWSYYLEIKNIHLHQIKCCQERCYANCVDVNDNSEYIEIGLKEINRYLNELKDDVDQLAKILK